MGGLFFAGLICGRLWRGLLQGLMSAPARRGLLFCEEKWAKEFWGEGVDAWRRGVDFAGRKACTARRRVLLFVRKSGQKNFGAEFVSAFGGAEILRGAKPVRLAAGGCFL